jgi:hypothetical protein
MRFYLPEWDDLVDAHYDFLKDEYSASHSENATKNDHYIWQVMPKPPIDGVLISKSKILENTTKSKEIGQKGIHEYLRLPAGFPVICDCGAWDYINDSSPPYKSEETLRFYQRGRFDVGVTIDHLIVESIQTGDPTVNGNETKQVNLTPEDKKQRWQITIDNALEMYETWSSDEELRRSFRLMGAIQGWDVASYREAAKILLKKGFDYIGIGGLARSPTGSFERFDDSRTVCNVVRGVCFEIGKWRQETHRRVDVHVFGFARASVTRELGMLGVTSFDSASYLRSAWLGKSNYFLDGQEYTALRVPQVERSPKAKKALRSGADKYALSKLEAETLVMLREYDRGKISKREALQHLRRYSKEIGVHEGHVSEYEKTLDDAPWRRCSCAICRSIGIEVIIFRGNERNRRRGFHNVFDFYEDLRSTWPKILVMTTCTGKKDDAKSLIPAYLRYMKSPLFKTFWKAMRELPVDIKVLSAKFGLIDWHKPVPNYDQIMREDQIPSFVEQVASTMGQYQHVFFIGLGRYRTVVERAADIAGVNVQIYPRKDLTTRKALDVLEYSGQMSRLKEAVQLTLGETSGIATAQRKLDTFA